MRRIRRFNDLTDKGVSSALADGCSAGAASGRPPIGRHVSALSGLETHSPWASLSYETLAWFGLLAPAKTPREIVTALHSEVQSALSRPEVQETLARLGSEASGMGPAGFQAFISREIAKYSKIIKDAGIKPD